VAPKGSLVKIGVIGVLVAVGGCGVRVGVAVRVAVRVGVLVA
jgi:hypothetical protein